MRTSEEADASSWVSLSESVSDILKIFARGAKEKPILEKKKKRKKERKRKSIYVIKCL